MIGSFAPQEKPHTVTVPRHGWEEAPKGMLARGSYKATTQFMDDDKNIHLEFTYSFGKSFSTITLTHLIRN
jgi:Rho GDP-dissociation inhibitor